jgi:hypothetical protein
MCWNEILERYGWLPPVLMFLNTLYLLQACYLLRFIVRQCTAQREWSPGRDPSVHTSGAHSAYYYKLTMLTLYFMQASQYTTYGKLQVLIPRIVFILDASLILSYFILISALHQSTKTYGYYTQFWSMTHLGGGGGGLIDFLNRCPILCDSLVVLKIFLRCFYYDNQLLCIFNAQFCN